MARTLDSMTSRDAQILLGVMVLAFVAQVAFSMLNVLLSSYHVAAENYAFNDPSGSWSFTPSAGGVRLADPAQVWGPFETSVQPGAGNLNVELVLYRKNQGLSHLEAHHSFELYLNGYYRRYEREDWQRIWFWDDEAPPSPSAQWGREMPLVVRCQAKQVACDPIVLHTSRFSAAHYRWSMSANGTDESVNAGGPLSAWLGDAALIMLQTNEVTPFEKFEDLVLFAASLGGIGYFVYAMVWGPAAPARGDWTSVKYQTLVLGVAASALCNPFSDVTSYGIGLITLTMAVEWMAYAYLIFFMLSLLDRFALDSEEVPEHFYTKKAVASGLPAVYFFATTTLLILEGWSPGTTVFQRRRRINALIIFVALPIFVWIIMMCVWGFALAQKCRALYTRRPYLDTTYQLTVLPTAVVLAVQMFSALLALFFVSRHMRRAVSNIITVLYALFMMYLECPAVVGAQNGDAAHPAPPGLPAVVDDTLEAMLPAVPEEVEL